MSVDCVSLHDFELLNPIAQTPATRTAIAQMTDTLRKICHASPSRYDAILRLRRWG